MAGQTSLIDVDLEDQERIETLLSTLITRGVYHSNEQFYATLTVSRSSYDNINRLGKASRKTLYTTFKTLLLQADDPLVQKYLPEEVEGWGEPEEVEGREKPAEAPDLPINAKKLIPWGVGSGLLIISLAIASIYFRPLSPEEEALSYLSERGISLNHDDIRSALATADIQTLRAMQRAGAQENTLATLLGEEARQFFLRSSGNQDATEWLMSLVDLGLFPNFLLRDRNGRYVALLFHAINSSNIDLAIALLDAGASPHPFVENSNDERFMHPIRFASGLSIPVAKRDRLIQAMLEHGAVFIRPSIQHGNPNFYYSGVYTDWIERFYRRLDEGLPANIASQRTDFMLTLGRPRDERLCTIASDADGQDWCRFIQSVPGALENFTEDHNGRPISDQTFLQIIPIEVIQIVEENAYFLAFSYHGAYDFTIMRATYGTGEYSVLWENGFIDYTADPDGEVAFKWGDPARNRVRINPNDADFDATRDDNWYRR